MHNRVYYRIQQQAQERGETLDIPEERLRKLSLAGGVMAQVARANPEVTGGEQDVMVDALQTHWNLRKGRPPLWRRWPSRSRRPSSTATGWRASFSDTCSHEEAMQFVDVLFAIATADGQASEPEIEEIRQIAGSLKLFHKEFIDAKLRVPRALRTE